MSHCTDNVRIFQKVILVLLASDRRRRRPLKSDDDDEATNRRQWGREAEVEEADAEEGVRLLRSSHAVYKQHHGGNATPWWPGAPSSSLFYAPSRFLILTGPLASDLAHSLWSDGTCARLLVRSNDRGPFCAVPTCTSTRASPGNPPPSAFNI